MKTLTADSRIKFILYKFQAFFKKKDISIEFLTPYQCKQNK